MALDATATRPAADLDFNQTAVAMYGLRRLTGIAEATFGVRVNGLDGGLNFKEQSLKHYDEWGSESTYPHFAAGWAVALNAPFTYTKQVASDFDGTRNGMVIRWPKGIKAKNHRDDALRIEIQRVCDEHHHVYAPRKPQNVDLNQTALASPRSSRRQTAERTSMPS